MRHMTPTPMAVVLGTVTGVAATVVLLATQLPGAGGERSRLAGAHRLATLDGASLRTNVVDVTYEPGGSSTPHSHPCPVVGYVLEGALRMRVNDQPEVIYRAGETFYEPPHAKHLVSANASEIAPARFIAVFTCDREAPLSASIPHAAR